MNPLFQVQLGSVDGMSGILDRYPLHCIEKGPGILVGDDREDHPRIVGRDIPLPPPGFSGPMALHWETTEGVDSLVGEELHHGGSICFQEEQQHDLHDLSVSEGADGKRLFTFAGSTGKTGREANRRITRESAAGPSRGSVRATPFGDLIQDVPLLRGQRGHP